MMAESRQIPDEGAPDGNRLNRGDFLRRTELLRRIHWKTWMLLVSFAVYGVLPFAAVQFGEIGKEFFPLLLFVPTIFFLENRLNGKRFRCPVCQTPFRLETAALVVASGRCPACSEEILELPDGAGGWSHMEFLAFHRRQFAGRKTECIAAILAVVIFALAWLCAFPVIALVIPSLRRPVRILLELDPLCLSGAVFAVFMLGYLANRMPWRRARKFDCCPHCHGRFDDNLPEIAVATGRCGRCGWNLFADFTPPPVQNHLYRLQLQNEFAPEFHWFVQALAAIALVFGSLSDYALFFWIGIPGAELALLVIYFLRQRRNACCRHHRASRLVKVSGHCGTCGSELTSDESIFRPVNEGETAIPFLDCGLWRTAILLGAFLLILWLMWQAVALLLAAEVVDGRITRVLLALLMTGGVIAVCRFCLREQFQGIILAPEKLVLVGKKDLVIPVAEVEEFRQMERVEQNNREKNCLIWRFVTAKKTCSVSERAFGNFRRGREQFDVWLHTVGLKGENIAESVPEEFRETVFRVRQPENTAEWKKWRKNALYMCIVLVAGILMIAIGIACKFLWMFIIGMLILLLAVLFFAVRGELPARRNFLRKYDGVTFLQDGLLLTGSKPKRIPREKIHQVTFSTAYENKEEILIADFYLKSLLNTAALAFQLRSDYFTEPERFAASCRLWHKTLFDREGNHGVGT